MAEKTGFALGEVMLLVHSAERIHLTQFLCYFQNKKLEICMC